MPTLVLSEKISFQAIKAIKRYCFSSKHMPSEAQSTLELQRAEALRLHIEPAEAGQEAALASTIAKVLGDVVSSYEQFLLAEFLRNPGFKSAYEANPQVFDAIKQSLALRAVNLSFASCDVSLAPAPQAQELELFDNQVRTWEREVFPVYRDEIVNVDYNDVVVAQRVLERYTVEQRAGIFRPLMAMIGDGSKYTVNVGQGLRATRRLRKPNKELLRVYAPKILPALAPPADKNIIAYMQVRTMGDGNPDLSRKGIKQVYYVEEMEKDTYPFKPDILRYDGHVFFLNRKLETQVVVNEGLYFITSDELDITVWGESREAVEDAFAFSFYALYQNYCLEENDNLDEGATELKEALKSLIQSTVQQ